MGAHDRASRRRTIGRAFPKRGGRGCTPPGRGRKARHPAHSPLGDSVIVHFDPGPGRLPTQLLDSDTANIAHAVAAYLRAYPSRPHAFQVMMAQAKCNMAT
jgi:hypothetical protein